jgi:hypothetical protein
LMQEKYLIKSNTLSWVPRNTMTMNKAFCKCIDGQGGRSTVTGKMNPNPGCLFHGTQRWSSVINLHQLGVILGNGAILRAQCCSLLLL